MWSLETLRWCLHLRLHQSVEGHQHSLSCKTKIVTATAITVYLLKSVSAVLFLDYQESELGSNNQNYRILSDATTVEMMIDRLHNHVQSHLRELKTNLESGEVADGATSLFI